MRSAVRRLFLVLAAFLLLSSLSTKANDDDDDFSEFDDEIEVEIDEEQSADEQKTSEQEESIYEETLDGDLGEDGVEEEEDDPFADEEEFEGYEKDKKASSKSKTEPDLKIIKTTAAMRSSWDAYVLEMLMIGGLLVYALNFIAGRSKNARLATAWYQAHREILEANFSVVGDDGASAECDGGTVMKQTENVFSLWCSGRQCCEGMLVEIKLLKRQDLVSVIGQMLKPSPDSVTLSIQLGDGDMDSFVFAVVPSRIASRLQKEFHDLSNYCSEKRSGDKYGLPNSYVILSETSEVITSILNAQIIQEINRYEGIFESVHISDQYMGLKEPSNENQDSSTPNTPPKAQKLINFTFNVPGKGRITTNHMGMMRPLVGMALRSIDRVRAIKLTKDAAEKAMKRRTKAAEVYWKQTHAQRQEAAQQRREEKRRAEKEKIMEENDPVKARKMEEREHKKAMKRMQPRMKQLKVKMA